MQIPESFVITAIVFDSIDECRNVEIFIDDNTIQSDYFLAVNYGIRLGTDKAPLQQA